jgi:23S rRNA (guanosine2251-2'-O)-methyltransferase
MRRKARQATKAENRPRFWGRHAVAAALANPERDDRPIWVTPRAAPDFDIDPDIPVTFADAADLGRLVPRDAPHQGIVAEVERLPDIWLGDLLDEAEDGPAAAGARSGHRPAQCRRDPALGRRVRRARHRHAGPARAARIRRARQGGERRAGDGALGARRQPRAALDEIAEAGFWRVGLTGEAEMTLARRSARRGSRWCSAPRAKACGRIPAHCDALARLPISDRIESLNVSNAAAIALYAASGRLQSRLRLRPTVVIAREAATDRATGYRGDVTPNGKIVLRFRGTPPHPAEPKAAGQVTGFLAHELFHLWNARDGDFPADEAWVHEGSADYYSWLAVAAVWPQELKLEDRLQQAANSCRAFGGTRPVAQLNPRLRYSCGALAHWIVDVAARNASSGARTGFDLWAQLVRPGRDYTLAELREKVAELAPLASQPIADFIQTGWDWPKLARSLAAAGADVQGGEPGAQAMRFAAGRAIGRELCDGFSGAGWSEADGVYLTGEGCGDLGGRISVQEIGGADPMKDTQRVYDIVARACAEQAKLDLVLRGSGDPVRRTIRWQPAPPDRRLVRRDLDLEAVISEAVSSRSSSSRLIGLSLSAHSGSTWTWQVAQDRQPPHKASSSSKPCSRIFSITLQPARAATS